MKNQTHSWLSLPARAALLVLLALLPVSVSADETQALYRDVVRSCEQNSPAAAAEAYRRLARLAPGHPLAVKAELRLIETNRDYFDTLARYRVFLKDHPGYAENDAVHYRLGQLYYVHNNFSESLAEFGAVISNYASSPKRPAALYWAGNIRFSRAETVEAALLFRQVAASGDRAYAGPAAVRLGDISFEKKQYWSAITNYKSALKSASDPEVRLEAGFYLAECYFSVQKNAEAVKLYRETARNNPGTEFARLADERLAFIYMKSPWLKKDAPEKKPVEARRTPVKPGKTKYFYVQAGSFTDLRLANNLRLELKRYGFPSGFKRVGEGDHYLYKVRAGPYADQAAADQAGSEIAQKLKLEAFTVQEEE
jgi:TolA-binding protein